MPGFSDQLVASTTEPSTFNAVSFCIGLLRIMLVQ